MLVVVSQVLPGRRQKIQVELGAERDQDCGALDEKTEQDREPQPGVGGGFRSFRCDKLCSTSIFDVYKLLSGNLNCNCGSNNKRRENPPGE